MKDPASDFSLKHQPLEYYKCHLHTVLEKEKEGGDEVREKGEGSQVALWWWGRNLWIERDVFISVHERQRRDALIFEDILAANIRHLQ